MVQLIYCLSSLFLLLPTLSPAQNCLDVQDYIHTLSSTPIPGEAGKFPKVQEIIARHDTLFMAVYDKGIISAVINPDEVISILSVTPTWSDQPRALAIRGNHLYAADGTAGLQVYNISDAASPQWLAHIDTPGYAIDVGVTYERALILDDFLGLAVIDIHEVRAPQIIATLSMPGTPTRMQRSGNLLFISCGYDGLAVVDISFPDMPRLVDVLVIADCITDFAVGGNILALTDSSNSMGEILFFRIQESMPFLTEESSLILESGYSRNIKFFGDHLLVSGFEKGIHIINASAPSEPFVQAYYYSTMAGRSCFTVVGDYMVAAYSSLELVDFDPVENVPLSGFVPQEGGAAKVAVYDNYMYTAGSVPRLQVTDISDLNAPVVTVSMFSGSSDLITTHNGLLYLGGSNNNVEIFRLTDPLHPEMVSQLSGTRNVRYISFQDNLLVSIFSNELFLFDISNPAEPERLSTISPIYGVQADIQDDYLYVACSDSEGLQVYDISNPSSPLLVFEFQGSHVRPVYVDAYGNYLYAANDYSNDGFQVFDISNPESIELISSLPLNHASGPCFMRGGLVYLQHTAGPASVIEVNDPYQPVVIGTYGHHDRYVDMTTNGEHLFLLGASHGVEISLLQCPYITAVNPSPHWPKAGSLEIYPNPFNPRTNIEWASPKTATLQVAVFDLAGRRVALLADKVFSAGSHTLQWNGTGDSGAGLSSGVYLVKVSCPEFVLSQRISLVR